MMQRGIMCQRERSQVGNGRATTDVLKVAHVGAPVIGTKIEFGPPSCTFFAGLRAKYSMSADCFDQLHNQRAIQIDRSPRTSALLFSSPQSDRVAEHPTSSRIASDAS